MTWERCPFCWPNPEPRSVMAGKHWAAIVPAHGLDQRQLLITPKEHFLSIEDAPQEAAREFLIFVSRVTWHLRANFDLIDYNLVVNSGPAAGQSEEHAHVHLIPRRPGDVNDSRRLLAEDLYGALTYREQGEREAIAASLRTGSSDSDGLQSHRDRVGGSGPRQAPVYVDDSTRVEEGVRIGVVAPDHPSGELGSVSVGANSVLRSGTVIYADVITGDGLDCGHNVTIREGARIGSNVYLLNGAQVNRRVRIADGARVGGFVCSDAVIGEGASCFGSLVHSYRARQGGLVEPAPEIGQGALIGWGATVVGGVRIGRGSTVGAGAVVLQDVPDETTVVGVPSHPIDSDQDRQTLGVGDERPEPLA